MKIVLGTIQIIRPLNILFVMASIVGCSYLFIDGFNWNEVLLLAFSTACITAAGNIHNDIIDYQSDLINKPNKIVVNQSINVWQAYLLIFSFLILAVFTLFLIGSNQLIWIAVLASSCLAVYNFKLKELPVFGNLVVAGILALSVLQVLFLSGLPNQRAIIILSILVFIVNLIREIVKDVEDIEGDHETGARTLPILIGVKSSYKVLWSLQIVLYGFLMCVFIGGVGEKYYAICTAIVLLYFTFALEKSISKADYKKLSNILKLVMLSGLIFAPLLNYYN